MTRSARPRSPRGAACRSVWPVTTLSDVTPVAAVLRRPHTLLEGPRLDARGEMVFSDVLAGGLWACSPDGEVRELLPKRRGIGGVLPHAEGGWVISGSNVLHLRPDGSQRVLLADEAACGYNDVGTTAGGALLAGELRFRPFAGEEPRPGRLLRLDADGELHVLSEEIVWPNGIGASRDGSTAYVSDYAQKVVLAIAVRGGATREFCRVPEGSPDGLAVDSRGAVWVALGEAGAVARFLPDGTLDEVTSLPANFVSSLSFGGADMRDVLVTTADNLEEPELGGTLLIARSEIPGMPVVPVRV
jgi:sugar lactone lactonase YvrE